MQAFIQIWGQFDSLEHAGVRIALNHQHGHRATDSSPQIIDDGCNGLGGLHALPGYSQEYSMFCSHTPCRVHPDGRD